MLAFEVSPPSFLLPSSLSRSSLLPSALPFRLTYIGHATLLVEIGGITILTDPNFDRRLAGVLPRVGLPGRTWESLPDLDAVLLTHAHADHLSIEDLGVPARRGRVPLFAPPGVARWLHRRGYPDARPLAPGETVEFERASGGRRSWASGVVTCTVGAAAHQGSRYGIDRWHGRGAANTYLIDTGSQSVFFAGDTGLTDESQSLAADILWPLGRRLDVALLPIGYAPWWKPGFRRGHLSGADALTLFERLDARLLIPYHWGTFHHLTSGPFDAVRQVEPLLARHPRRRDVRWIAPGGMAEIAGAADSAS